MHTKEDSIKTMIAIVSSVLPYETITAESTMMNVDTWDSLSHMGIMAAIEKETGITLSQTEMMLTDSVLSLAQIIREH